MPCATPSRAARAAVAVPVEGTILSVADAAADAAAAWPGDDAIAVLAAAVTPPTTLGAHPGPDGGAPRGGGRRQRRARTRRPARQPAGQRLGRRGRSGDRTRGGQAGCPAAADARPAADRRPSLRGHVPARGTDDDVVVLRAELAELGEALLVVGGDGLWNVHVHVDDAGAALEAGVRAGRPHRIAVTHFGDQRARSEGARVRRQAHQRARRRRGVRRSGHDRAARGGRRTGGPRAAGTAARRAASCSTRCGVPVRRRSSSSRTTATSCRSHRPPRRRPAPRASGSRSSRRPPRCRCSPRWRCTTRGRRFDEDVVAMTGRRPCHPARRGHHRDA